MFRFFFTQFFLFLIGVCGWGLVGFGGWIAWRGLFLYAADPVLMGTGGGLAIGGLLVVALTLAARVQVVTAKTAIEILARLDNAALPAARGRAAPRLGSARDPASSPAPSVGPVPPPIPGPVMTRP